MSSAPDLTSRLLRQDRLFVGGALALLVALAWWYLASGAGMAAMPGMPSPPLEALILMWWIMMAAMMLPSAAPAILLYSRVRAQRSEAGLAAPWTFLLGYLLIWLMFSVVAAVLQDAIGQIDNPRLAAALLIAAGIYQLTPLKSACLGQCRSPAQFISRHWRPGPAGALSLGLLHGLYCLGCCWLLMALLFVGGVMNLLWVVALTLIVAVEKLVPRGEWFGRLAGLALIVWGVAIAVRA